MNCITLHDNATGTEHLTVTVSNLCLDNLKTLEFIGDFKRFSIDIHSTDAPRTKTKYGQLSEWLHEHVFYNLQPGSINQILKTP